MRVVASAFADGESMEKLSHKNAGLLAQRAANEFADYLVEKGWIGKEKSAAHRKKAFEFFQDRLGRSIPLDRKPFDFDSLADRAAGKTRSKINSFIREVEELGCFVEEFKRGVVNFPSLYIGRKVFLCWNPGDPHVMYWHELDESYNERSLDQCLVEFGVFALHFDANVLAT